MSPENRMRKYYMLTERGAAELAEDKVRWRGVQTALRKLLGPTPAANRAE
jgi:DNA-binding PadR family transcriptional regulator